MDEKTLTIPLYFCTETFIYMQFLKKMEKRQNGNRYMFEKCAENDAQYNYRSDRVEGEADRKIN